MPSERFYLNAPFPEKTYVLLEGQELHHLQHVMRIRVGEEVELINGKGALAKARLESLQKQSASLEILSCEQKPLPFPHKILSVPILRMAKLEWILEKGTELGINRFWLYPAEHAEKEALSPHQVERLRHILISAIKQSGRLDLPTLEIRDRFADLFHEEALYFYGDTRENAPHFPSSLPQGATVFITGPESGFSPKEKEKLEQKAKGVRLHANILRAETAPLVAAVYLDQSLSSFPR